MCLGHSEADNQHAQWLLEIGAGSTMDNNKMIQVSQSMVCANLNALINRIYPRISNPRVQDNQYFLDCIILCPKNDQVYDINEAILQQFNPNAEIHMLRSVDSVSKEVECTMPILQGFFNNLMLVDCLLLYSVSRLALQLSY